MSFFKNLFQKKEDPINSYADFWQWFKTKEQSFFKVIKNKGAIEKVFFNAISPKLDELQEGIFYLTGMCDDHTVELILTPDGNIKNVAIVEELVQAAPKITGWKFTALKPSLDIENVGIVMRPYEFNKNNLHFYSVEHKDYPDEIDIVVIHDDFTEENAATITNGTYIFLDNYLGELNFITSIDNVTLKGKKEAAKELVPIRKLKDFIMWRQKEFIEKYQGLRHHTEEDNYSLLTAEMEDGKKLIAVINTDLLSWESKASHPWAVVVEIKYEGENNGMPSEQISTILNQIEEDLLEELKDFEGYLNIGRQTSDNLREIYFACKDFRKPSIILHRFQQRYTENLSIDFEIYKDKYWRSYNRFGVQ